MIENSYLAERLIAARSRDRLEAAQHARLAAQARPRRRARTLAGRRSARHRPAPEPCAPSSA